MRDFRKYLVWKKGHEFALEVYQQTNSFPKAELFAFLRDNLSQT